jgi:hypothetical protein
LRLRLLRRVDEHDEHPHQTFASLGWLRPRHTALAGQNWRQTAFSITASCRSHEQRDRSVVWLGAPLACCPPAATMGQLRRRMVAVALLKGSETTAARTRTRRKRGQIDADETRALLCSSAVCSPETMAMFSFASKCKKFFKIPRHVAYVGTCMEH